MIDNEETSSNGSGIGLAVGAVGLVAAVGYGLYRKHKAKKQNKDEEKPKTKKKIVWQKPWNDLNRSLVHHSSFVHVHHFVHFCYLFLKYKFIMLEYYLHKGS